MRIGLIATVIAFFILINSYSALADWGIKRYTHLEIKKIYKSSQFFFDRDRYHKAIRILKTIGDHQHTIVENHIAAIRILLNWRPSQFKGEMRSLANLGISKKELYKESCDYTLKNHEYSMYEICAKNNSEFIIGVDDQIKAMLADYYNRLSKPFYSFRYLAALVNKDELTGNYAIDSDLLRNRIRFKLESKNCYLRNSDCSLPSSSIKQLIKMFVYY